MTGFPAVTSISILQHRRPDLLLDFKTPGDKWQTVHAWLLSARRVKG
jgi:hypothetical protein